MLHSAIFDTLHQAMLTPYNILLACLWSCFGTLSWINPKKRNAAPSAISYSDPFASWKFIPIPSAVGNRSCIRSEERLTSKHTELINDNFPAAAIVYFVSLQIENCLQIPDMLRVFNKRKPSCTHSLLGIQVDVNVRSCGSRHLTFSKARRYCWSSIPLCLNFRLGHSRLSMTRGRSRCNCISWSKLY